jgi:hypothetical protein
MRMILLSLLATLLLVPGARAEKRVVVEPRTEQVVRHAANIVWAHEDSATGGTRGEAEQKALEKARQILLMYLIREQPGIVWVPVIDDLRRLGLVAQVEVSKDPVVVNPDVGAQYVAHVRLVLTEGGLRSLRDEDQRQREQQAQERVLWRQGLLAKVLAALVALLAVTAGYLRLEEGTRGYYTGLLRVLLVVCLGVIGGGLWLVL